MKIGIGIDTGGTYTDAVVYDFESRKVLGSAKSLTTKYDLKVGILGAVDALPQDLVKKAQVVSLSTTLATNACVEDKSGRAKLIFFGVDKNTVDNYGKKFGLPDSEQMYIQEKVNWPEFEKDIAVGFEDLDGVGIIEMNSKINGDLTEKTAKELFLKQHNMPVVCGHELFSELNCLRRGAGTLLNAGLIPIITQFLASVKEALNLRGINPESVVIVRSDGGLMTEEFASLHPVETLLCGPAASTIGCKSLVDEKNCIIVDMGGTTTDIAFINKGLPATATGGVSIGKWKTFVNGLYVKTVGLGGDSAIHYKNEELLLEEYRILPLCVGAHKYPCILENLRNLEVRKHTKYLYEHFVLIKDISKSSRYSEEEKAFCEALKKKPLSLAQAAFAVGKEIYTLKVDRLLKDGVVQICGLTPTDIMHIKGDFESFNKEAALLGAKFVAFNLNMEVEKLCERVYSLVKKKLYSNIVFALLENEYPHYLKNGINEDVKSFVLESFNKANEKNSLFKSSFKVGYTLVGAGAPAGIFLKDVAELLGTKAVLPENCQVANALGAIAASVGAKASAEIKENESGGFTVFGCGEKKDFNEIEPALEYAKEQAENEAKRKALEMGARGEINLFVKVQSNEAPTKFGEIYLGTVVTANAVGTMGF